MDAEAPEDFEGFDDFDLPELSLILRIAVFLRDDMGGTVFLRQLLLDLEALEPRRVATRLVKGCVKSSDLVSLPSPVGPLFRILKRKLARMQDKEKGKAVFPEQRRKERRGVEGAQRRNFVTVSIGCGHDEDCSLHRCFVRSAVCSSSGH